MWARSETCQAQGRRPRGTPKATATGIEGFYGQVIPGYEHSPPRHTAPKIPGSLRRYNLGL